MKEIQLKKDGKMLQIISWAMILYALINLIVNIFRIIPLVTGAISALQISVVIYAGNVSISLILSFVFFYFGYRSVLKLTSSLNKDGKVSTGRIPLIFTILAQAANLIYCLELRVSMLLFLIPACMAVVLMFLYTVETKGLMSSPRHR